jgi:hypothetical protein
LLARGRQQRSAAGLQKPHATKPRANDGHHTRLPFTQWDGAPWLARAVGIHSGLLCHVGRSDCGRGRGSSATQLATRVVVRVSAVAEPITVKMRVAMVGVLTSDITVSRRSRRRPRAWLGPSRLGRPGGPDRRMWPTRAMLLPWKAAHRCLQTAQHRRMSGRTPGWVGMRRRVRPCGHARSPADRKAGADMSYLDNLRWRRRRFRAGRGPDRTRPRPPGIAWKATLDASAITSIAILPRPWPSDDVRSATSVVGHSLRSNLLSRVLKVRVVAVGSLGRVRLQPRVAGDTVDVGWGRHGAGNFIAPRCAAQFNDSRTA